MALVRQCDRCKAAFDHTPEEEDGRNAVVVATMAFGSNSIFQYYIGDDIKQLCPECMSEIKAFLENSNTYVCEKVKEV